MKETLTEEFWSGIFAKTDLAKAIKDKFSVGHVSMITEKVEDTEDDTIED